MKRKDDYYKQLSSRRQSDALFRAYILWNAAKHRARVKKIEFSLSRELVEQALFEGYCQATGLQFNLLIKQKRMGALSPSIDRRDPNLGYSDENTQVVCWIYNRAKGDGSHEDVMCLVMALTNPIEKQKHKETKIPTAAELGL